MRSVFFAMRSVSFTMRSVFFAMRSVSFTMRSVFFAMRSVYCAVRSVRVSEVEVGTDFAVSFGFATRSVRLTVS